jgi:preprotein translocase subunit YajC
VGRVLEETSEGSLVKEIAPLLWIVAIVAIFWLLILRPAARRQKQIAQVQSSIAPGETVVLTSGIFGTVVATEDATLTLEVAPGVHVKVARGAVGSIVREDDEATEATEATDGETTTDADTEER